MVPASTPGARIPPPGPRGSDLSQPHNTPFKGQRRTTLPAVTGAAATERGVLSPGDTQQGSLLCHSPTDEPDLRVTGRGRQRLGGERREKQMAGPPPLSPRHPGGRPDPGAPPCLCSSPPGLARSLAFSTRSTAQRGAPSPGLRSCLQHAQLGGPVPRFPRSASPPRASQSLGGLSDTGVKCPWLS